MRRNNRRDQHHEIHLHGVFDASAALGVEATLARAEPHARLRVDLTHIREFHDSAIAVLAQALKRCAADVAVRGLRQHQIRMLRYLGVDTPPLEQDAVPGAGPA
jgi:anti-anti-sigma regulatory factor